MKSMKKLFIAMAMMVLAIGATTCRAEAKGSTYALLLNGMGEGEKDNIVWMQSVLRDNQLSTYDQIQSIQSFTYNAEKLNSPGTSKETIKAQINGAFTGSTGADLALFYFCGHGSTEGICLKQGWISSEVYSYRELANELSSINAERIVVFMDCCYSEQFIDVIPENNRNRFIVFSSAKKDEPGKYWPDANASYFTAAVALGLGYNGEKAQADMNQDCRVTVQELSDYIYVYLKGNLVSGWEDTNPVSHFTERNRNFVLYETSMELSNSSVKMYKNTTKKIKVTLPASSSNVKWTSSNPSVATVSQTGKISAKSAGKTTITASINGKRAICTVTVLEPTIKLNLNKATLDAAGSSKLKTVQLKATVKGASKEATWKSSNPKVAAVSAKGKVTAKKAGTATITAAANGKRATCKITVISSAVDISSVYNGYLNFILKNKDTYGNYPKISIADVNKDKIPELFISVDWEYRAYTYKNNKLVKIGQFDEGPYLNVLTNGTQGIICSCGDSIGVYELKNGKFERTQYYIYHYPDTESFEQGAAFKNNNSVILNKYCYTKDKTQCQKEFQTAMSAYMK